MCAIAANALYTSLCKRGTTRQLASTIITCVASALLLLPALLWYNVRLSDPQAMAPVMEIVAILTYISLCGWLLPLGTTAAYCLYARPRVSTTALRIPQLAISTPRLQPPRSQAGIQPPFVFRADLPWGWLEYRSGNFTGQRLALKRAVVTLGRDEESDIWLDDKVASRNHAELACDQNQLVYLTDLSSLNGLLLNGQPVRGTVYVQSNDVIEAGSYRFLFVLAERRAESAEEEDPLAWRATSSPGIIRGEEGYAPVTPLPFSVAQLPFSGSGLLSSGPAPLRLPSKQKIQE